MPQECSVVRPTSTSIREMGRPFCGRPMRLPLLSLSVRVRCNCVHSSWESVCFPFEKGGPGELCNYISSTAGSQPRGWPPYLLTSSIPSLYIETR